MGLGPHFSRLQRMPKAGQGRSVSRKGFQEEVLPKLDTGLSRGWHGRPLSHCTFKAGAGEGKPCGHLLGNGPRDEASGVVLAGSRAVQGRDRKARGT